MLLLVHICMYGLNLTFAHVSWYSFSWILPECLQFSCECTIDTTKPDPCNELYAYEVH